MSGNKKSQKPWKPDDLLNTMAAVRYLQTNKSTFLRYARDGKIKRVNPGEARPLYSVADLDNLRVVLATHKPQGGRPTKVAQEVDKELGNQLTELIKAGSVGILQELLGDDPVTEDRAEELLRRVFTKLAIENRLVEEQVALALHPRPETKQKALDTIWNRILPSLKSQTVIKKTDSESQQLQATLADKMDALRIEMQKARLLPGAVFEGEIIDTATDPMDTGLLVPVPA